MVSPQATQDSNSPHPRPGDWLRGDSVRITAQQRRHVLVEFLTDALESQRVVSESERTDRKAVGGEVPHGFFSTADLRVSNAAAVQQWIASNLAAHSDNREFGVGATS